MPELVPMDAECIHGLTTRTCSTCLGKLRARPYRQVMERVAPGFLPTPENEKPRKDCELCAKRPASVGNRIYVRLPRPPRKAWGQDVPPYPPTFFGPLVEAPRIYKATHKDKKGRHVCDRCSPKGRAPERIHENPPKVVAMVLKSADVFDV